MAVQTDRDRLAKGVTGTGNVVQQPVFIDIHPIVTGKNINTDRRWLREDSHFFRRGTGVARYIVDRN
ncbi:hypothetical protein D3C75_1149710 [compost metagenome]